jgi:DNA-binding SARP family transcriptional activator
VSVADVRGRDPAHPPPASHVRLLILGGFDLAQGGESVPLPRSAQRVLAFLALHDRPLARPYVAGSLWQDSTDKRASGSLRSALWALGHSGQPLIETTGSCLRLVPSLYVDYRQAMALAASVLNDSKQYPESVLERHFLFAELLCDWYDDWVVSEREQFRQLRLHVLEALCERLVEEGRFARAVQAGLAAVMGEPLRESAQRVLIRAYLAEGNPREALRQYEAYRVLLREELDISPSREMQTLIETVTSSR